LKITVNNKKTITMMVVAAAAALKTTILPALQISTPGLGNEEDPM
jgi:hypothetical protein